MEVPRTGIDSRPDAALERRTAATASGVVLDIGGLPVRVQTDPGVAEVVAAQLAGCHADPRPPELSLLWDDASDAKTPSTAPTADWTDVRVWSARDGTTIFSRSGVVAEVNGGDIHLAGHGDEPAVALRRLLPLVLATAMASVDRFVVHGAAVSDGSRAVLALGPSGSGKSTFAVAGLLSGRRVLADDLLVLRRAPSEPGAAPAVLVRGIPRRIAVPSELLAERWSDVRSIPEDPRRRFELAVEAQDFESECVVAGVVRVGHHESAAGATLPLDPDALLFELVSAFSAALASESLRRFWRCARSLASQPSAQLLLARDHSARVSQVGDHLASHLG